MELLATTTGQSARRRPSRGKDEDGWNRKPESKKEAESRRKRAREEYCKLLLPLVSCPRATYCSLPTATQFALLIFEPIQESSSSLLSSVLFVSFSFVEVPGKKAERSIAWRLPPGCSWSLRTRPGCCGNAQKAPALALLAVETGNNDFHA